MRAFAISEHARMNRSFSGTFFAFFLAARLISCEVKVIVAMVKKITPRLGGRLFNNEKRPWKLYFSGG